MSRTSMSRRICTLALCLLLAGCAWAQLPPDYTIYTEPGFPHDPILELRPPFPRSLPVQVILNGIVLTLTAVLFIQLLFTAQYHWPLAPVNFVLQLAAVFMLLVNATVSTHIVFKAVDAESRSWPYMLNYVAVDIPPSPPVYLDWPTGDLTAWFLMTATCAGLIQITHIQFLTLLFPSKLEKRLIYITLVPLAILAAVMQLLRVSARHKLYETVVAVQNICNATLSLLFTGSLFIWGLLVNRRNAWRTDGGTAAFGIGALTLAPMSTAVAFLYVPTKEQYTWMPQLMWAIILWQSFLGWWWWVGAGMGVGEVDDLLYREEKRKQKRAQRSTRRRQQRERAETMLRGVTGALGFRRSSSSEERAALVRTNTETSTSTSASTSGTAGGTLLARVMSHTPGKQVYDWVLYWRREHLRAAREQAIQRVERHQQCRGGRGSLAGWGLGSFGIQRVRRRRGSDTRDDATAVASDSERDPDAAGSPTHDKTDTSSDTVAGGDSASHERGDAVNEETLPTAKAGETDTAAVASPWSVWWLGPLRRWRLKDSTVY